MLAHTLKGVAGNIGTPRPAAQAARLEECCAMRTGAAGGPRADWPRWPPSWAS
jgi:HPt (histidine-containing phosphotransfer) domain-containing protein